MKNSLDRFLLVACCFVISACAGVGIVHVSNLNKPPKAMLPRAPESVTVFIKSLPSKPYTEVMLLEVSFSNADEMVAEVRNEAANRGCDGVIFSAIKRMEPEKSPTKEPEQHKPGSFGEAAREGAIEGLGKGMFPVDDKETTATCIVYNE